MHDNRIRDFMHAQPFKPFDIRVSDGRVYTNPAAVVTAHSKG